jgi:hypothetical protein
VARHAARRRQAGNRLGQQPEQLFTFDLDMGESFLQLGYVSEPLLLAGSLDAPVDVGFDLVEIR